MTVGELLVRMSSYEFSEWMEFWKLEKAPARDGDGD